MRRARPMLGTFIEIAAAGASPSAVSAAIDVAFATVAKVHRLMSFHDDVSDVSRLNRDAAALPVQIHSWTYQVLEASVEFYRVSAGAFDIAIAPTLQSLHLLPAVRDASQPEFRPSRDCSAIELLPECRVRFHGSVKIDLGGIAKGFAVDRAIDRLREHGMLQGLVNAGGDLAAFGPETATVHIRDPRNPLSTLCRTEIANEALASSGGRFEPFSAATPLRSTVIDPRTERAVTAVLGASVRASSCMIADALTKVVMVVGARALPLLDHYRASAMFVSASSDLHITGDWHARVHRVA